MKLWIFIITLVTSTMLSAETLIVGITASNPPFSTTDDNSHHYSGFDIAIMDAVAKRINVQLKYMPMLFDDFFEAVDNGGIDLAIDSIIITTTLQKQYLLSLPYLVSKVQFITNKDSPINSPKELVAKHIGVRQSGQFAHIFAQLFNDNIQVTVYGHMPELFEALTANKVDAIIINSPAAEYWSANNSQYKLIGDPMSLGLGFGILAKKGRTDLIEKINKALQDMENDKTYLEIYNRYFFGGV